MVLLITFLFTVLIAFPLGQVARIDLANGVAFSLLDIGVAAVFLIVLFRNFTTRKIKSKEIIFSIAPFIFLCLISLAVNFATISTQQFLISSLYLVRFIMYFSVVETVRQLAPKNKKLVYSSLLISGSLVLIFGYLQFIFFPDLRILYYAGWDIHYYRLFSTFLDPNFVGAFLVVFVLLQLYLLSFYSSKKIKRFIVGLIIFTIGGIILTFSRGSYAMLILGLGLYFFMLGKRKLVIGIVVSLFVIFSVVAFFPGQHREATNLFRTVSTGARIGNMQNAWKIAKDHLLFGVGFNTYRYVQHKYGIFTGDTWQQGHGNSGADNSWLFVLATTGIPGLLAYAGFFVFVLKELWKKVRVRDTKTVMIFTTIITIGAGSIITDLLFYPSIIFWLWIMVGLID